METRKTASNILPDQECTFKKRSSSKVFASSETSERMKGKTIVKPIVYGSFASYLGTEREDGHTHQWTICLRSYDNEDMSVYIKRVQFKLHSSYPEPIRVFTSPPYSLTETGWGGFEIAIKIFFVDSCEKPVILHHFLKLFHLDENGKATLSYEPVISEFYDELVFTDPTLKMHQLLINPRVSTSPFIPHKIDYEKKKAEDLQTILAAKKKIAEQIAVLKAKMANTKADLAEAQARSTK